MPVTSIDKDPAALTMQVVFDTTFPQQRLWDAFADPRQLERFWGPPTYPSQFAHHDFVPGGSAAYVMVGPDGDESGGWWEFLAVTPPNSFEVLDGFALPDGSRNNEMPATRMLFEFSTTDAGSRMTATTFFNSAAELEQLIAMGMEEGTRQAMGQIDAVLAE
jgi:uncharacterized protein YndB with AHSA1/START domain